ncbi:hypothetical protein [Vibrio mediterranei]|uniref:hypothetical protein n=1 Tax=Vibrio mediterranei TaxID=689 RepID=UPI00406902EC
MPFTLTMLHPKNGLVIALELNDDLTLNSVAYQDGETIELSQAIRAHIDTHISNLNENGELEAFRIIAAKPPATSITEEGIDNVVHATESALLVEGIALDSDALSILNQRIESFLHHDMAIELY